MSNFTPTVELKELSMKNFEVKLISESFVKPKFEVEASKKPHYLGPTDLAFLSLDQMQMGVLFSQKPQNVQTDLVEKLKTSLSITLVHFYPLAGQLATQKFPDEHAIWVYVDCNKGPGARIIHAAIDITVADIVSSVDVPPVVRRYFFDLGDTAVNYDGHTNPLCSFQVTELLDGLFFSVTMNHSIADGVSMVCFLHTFVEVFHQLDRFGSGNNGDISISRRPIFKPFVPDNHDPMIKLPYLEQDEFIIRFEPALIRERIFPISSNQAIALLKAKANEECGVKNITSLQALSAFMWKCITRARNLDWDEETTLAVPANARTRLNPPLSEDHFGNYLYVVQATCKVGELLANGLGFAAMLINQSLVATNDKEVRAKLAGYVMAPFVIPRDRVSPLNKANRVVIGGSLGSSSYGLELGLGKAVAALGGYANKNDGKVSANPGIREGSTELEVCLKPEIMSALELDEEFMSFLS